MMVLAALVAAAMALPGCKIALDEEKYDLSDMSRTWVISSEVETPPTVTNLTWYYNPCGAVDQDNCPANSQLCGVETVSRDGESEITQIIPIIAEGNGAERSVDRYGDTDGQGLRFIYSGATWGELAVRAEVVFACDSKPKFVSGEDSWEDGSLVLRFSTPSVCADRDEKPAPSPPDSGASRGFFGSIFHLVWLLFMFFVVVAIVMGVLVFLRYRATGQAPVTREDLENLVRDLPYLVRDFVRKIKETFGGSSRGYAAL